MKKDWKYKKLGEVCEVFCDGDWIESKDQSEDGIRLIQTGNVGNGVYRDKADKSKYISEETFKQLNCTEIFPGDILVSRLPDPIGRACIIPETGSRMITAVDCSIIRLKECINSNLFVYYTRSDSYSKNIDKFTTGTTRKRISRSNLALVSVPIPPKDEQQQIVAELDLLSGMIEKQKAQIEELDKLSQSIFYDMFGDPTNNPKNFEVKPIDKVCLLKAGKAIKAEELSDYSEDLYPCFGGNGIRGYIDRFSHEGTFPIIGRQGALCGNVNLANGQFYATEHAVVVTPVIELDTIWLYYVLLSMRLGQYAHGVAQPGLSVKDINPLPIIFPPLSLQQEFAAKIEAIEAMKAKVRQSLKESETLFNSRMDYYFN